MKIIRIFRVPICLLGVLGISWWVLFPISDVLMDSIDDFGPDARLYWKIVDVWYWIVNAIALAFLFSLIQILFWKKSVKWHWAVKSIICIVVVVGVLIHWFGAFVVYKGGFF